MDAATRTFRQFLLFTQFYRPEKPLIICEGKTDKVYIQSALRQLANVYPPLSSTVNGERTIDVSFFNYSKVAERVLWLGGGTGDLKLFISKYGSEFGSFKCSSKRHPVILLLDNDGGAKEIFSAIKSKTKSQNSIDGSAPYYHIADNLYVVALPLLGGKPTTIEHFFPPVVLQAKLNGKAFSGEERFDATTQYGKHYFAEYVIKKNQKAIDFSGFDEILKRIQAVLLAHAAKKK